MVEISAGNGDREGSAEQTLVGRWWLAEAPRRKLHGTLRCRSGKRDRLELHGKLLDPDLSLTGHVIIGEVVDGSAVTICRAYYVELITHGSITTQSFECQSVLVGARFPLGEKTTFSGLSLQTNLLDSWVAKPRAESDFKVNEENGLSQFSLSIEQPAELVSTVPGEGTVRLHWGHVRQGGVWHRTVSVRPTIVVSFDQPLDLQEAWRRFVIPTLLLTTFATGVGDSISKLVLWQPPKRGKEPWTAPAAELVGASFGEPEATELSAYDRHYQLLRFDDVEPHFDRVARAWYSTYAVAHASLMDLFIGHFSPLDWSDAAFARIVRGLETWHRTVAGGEYMPAAEFKELLKTLIAAAETPAHRNFVRMRLAYANEWTLKQRLDALIDEAGEPIKGQVAAFDKFSRKVTDVRNAMTHSGNIGPTWTLTQVWHARKTLELVMKAVLLRRLGYSDDDVATFVLRTDDWRTVAGANVLLKGWSD